MKCNKVASCSALGLVLVSLATFGCSDAEDPAEPTPADGGQGGAGGSVPMAGKKASPNGGSTADGGDGGDPARDGGEAGAGGAAGSAPGAEEGRLVIADAHASTLYIYSVPSLQQLAVIDDVKFADHAGFVPLNDGRVLFTDSATNELISLRVLGDEPAVVGRAALTYPAIHLAVDPAHEYAAISGAGPAAGEPGAFTLVRLVDFYHRSVPIPTGEPGVLLGGSPLYVYHRNDDLAQVEAYLFEDLWKGTVSLKGSVAIGVAPHGEALAHAEGKMFVAADDGINVIPTAGAELGDVTQIPYDIDGRTGGRAFYARLSVDAKYLYSYLRDSGPNYDWAWKDWVSDAYVVDVQNETAKRIEIGKGLVYRLADSEKYAMFVQYHPDGDFAHFMDTDAKSDTFQEIIAKVPLEAMSKTPTEPEADPWSSEAFRMAGMVPSGRYAFVSHGGDGKVSMIDTASMEVAGEIELPTPLDYGGYLLGVEPGAVVRDTVGR